MGGVPGVDSERIAGWGRDVDFGVKLKTTG
jgi:hypothetical protein